MTRILQYGCAHGRFQVFHLDHLAYLKSALEFCEHLIVGITSYNIRRLVPAGGSHRVLEINNPLTYYERVQMISANLIEELRISRERFSFTPFPIEEPSFLPDFVPLTVPLFTTVREEWNRNKIKALLALGYSVVVLREDLKKEISGLAIRQSMLVGGSTWEQWVSPATRRFVKDLGLEERLRKARN